MNFKGVDYMKDGKYEITDLNDADRFVALTTLLIVKGIITEDEIKTTLQAVVDKKNAELEKELKENVGFKFIFDMLKK
jgi:hypothetical protein